MLEIKVDQSLLTSGSFPIRCCIDSETLKSADLVSTPLLYVLLSVVPDNQKGAETSVGERDIFPLDRLQQFVTIHKPGEHHLTAWLIPAKDEGDLVKYKEFFFDWSNGRYRNELFGYDGNPKESFHSKNGYLPTKPAQLSVVMPAECFAPEPPKWLESWVNLWHSRPPRDQCAFRRRSILAFTIQPFLLTLWALIILPLAIFFTLLLGFWWVDWSALKDWANPGETLELWGYGAASKNAYGKAFKWLFSFLPEPKRSKGNPYSPDTLKREREEKERAAFHQLQEKYGRASCQFVDVPAEKLVSPTKKVYLAYHRTKQKVCKPFKR